MKSEIIYLRLFRILSIYGRCIQSGLHVCAPHRFDRRAIEGEKHNTALCQHIRGNKTERPKTNCKAGDASFRAAAPHIVEQTTFLSTRTIQ